MRGPYHVVHNSVVQLVNSTWYAEERGKEQARHRVKKFVLCAPTLRHAGFPAFSRYYINEFCSNVIIIQKLIWPHQLQVCSPCLNKRRCSVM